MLTTTLTIGTVILALLFALRHEIKVENARLALCPMWSTTVH